MENWRILCKLEIDERPVKLEYFEDGGGYKVTTTQKGTVTTKGIFEPETTVLPMVISDGDPVEIESDDYPDLEHQLYENGFSENDINQIISRFKADLREY